MGRLRKGTPLLMKTQLPNCSSNVNESGYTKLLEVIIETDKKPGITTTDTYLQPDVLNVQQCGHIMHVIQGLTITVPEQGRSFFGLLFAALNGCLCYSLLSIEYVHGTNFNLQIHTFDQELSVRSERPNLII